MCGTFQVSPKASYSPSYVDKMKVLKAEISQAINMHVKEISPSPRLHVRLLLYTLPGVLG